MNLQRLRRVVSEVVQDVAINVWTGWSLKQIAGNPEGGLFCCNGEKRQLDSSVDTYNVREVTK